MITSRYAWGALAGTALFLELCALFFQHVLKLDPCVMCIYQRAAVTGVLVAGLIGWIAPSRLWLRLPGYLSWGAGAGWGLYLALKQSGLQRGLIAPSLDCTFDADFPSWAKLDQWLPWMFQPTGYCEDIQWSFLGLSMPQWMVIIFAAYLLVLLAGLAAELRRGST